jgi:UDP-glucuronate decarboxylase
LIGTRKISETSRSILITGATGFIGTQLTEILQSNPNFTVTTTSKKSKPKVVNQHYFVNLMNSIETLNLIQNVRPKILIHLAWIATPNEYANSNLNQQWLTSSKHLFQEFVNHGGQQIIIAGSCAEYKQNKDGIPLTELSELRDDNNFSKSKNELLDYTRQLAQHSNLVFVWLRFFYLYGNGEPEEKLCSRILRSVQNGSELEIRSPDSLIDFIHVGDAVQFIYRSLDVQKSLVCNVGTGVGIKVRNLVDTIRQIYPDKLSVKFGAEDSIELVSDNTLLESVFGKHKFVTVEEYLSQRIGKL